LFERTIKDESLSQELAADLRKTQAASVLTSLKEWMLENYKAVLPQSAIGGAALQSAAVGQAYDLHHKRKTSDRQQPC